MTFGDVAFGVGDGDVGEGFLVWSSKVDADLGDGGGNDQCVGFDFCGED